MEYRLLGRSGLKVSNLTLGAMTFGGRGFFAKAGSSDVTEAQLVANLPAADLQLSADERAALDQASAPTMIYPYWHQSSTARDRLGAADLALHGGGAAPKPRMG